jgi:hypothetical protein
MRMLSLIEFGVLSVIHYFFATRYDVQIVPQMPVEGAMPAGDCRQLVHLKHEGPPQGRFQGGFQDFQKLVKLIIPNCCTLALEKHRRVVISSAARWGMSKQLLHLVQRGLEHLLVSSVCYR